MGKKLAQKKQIPRTRQLGIINKKAGAFTVSNPIFLKMKKPRPKEKGQYDRKKYGSRVLWDRRKKQGTIADRKNP